MRNNVLGENESKLTVEQALHVQRHDLVPPGTLGHIVPWGTPCRAGVVYENVDLVSALLDSFAEFVTTGLGLQKEEA